MLPHPCITTIKRLLPQCLPQPPHASPISQPTSHHPHTYTLAIASRREGTATRQAACTSREAGSTMALTINTESRSQRGKTLMYASISPALLLLPPHSHPRPCHTTLHNHPCALYLPWHGEAGASHGAAHRPGRATHRPHPLHGCLSTSRLTIHPIPTHSCHTPSLPGTQLGTATPCTMTTFHPTAPEAGLCNAPAT